MSPDVVQASAQSIERFLGLSCQVPRINGLPDRSIATWVHLQNRNLIVIHLHRRRPARVEDYTNLMQQVVPRSVVNGVETMTKATSNFQWADLIKGQARPFVSDGMNLFCRIGVQARECRCPACDSIVYSRRHNRCGVCEEVLPATCLFSNEEADKIQALLRTERQRHRTWCVRIEDG